MPSIITRTTSGTDATVKGLPLTNAEIDGNFIAINHAIIATGDLTGFTDRSASTLVWNNATRTIFLAPVVGSFSVYYRGSELTVSDSLQYQIPNNTGGRWIILNPSTLQLEESLTIDFETDLPVAWIYYNHVDAVAIVASDERHTASRDIQWHISKHAEVGTTWLSGGDCTYNLNNQTSLSLGFTDITIADEDINHDISHSITPNGFYQQILSSNAMIPVVYKNGSVTSQIAAANPPWQVNTTAKYNQVIGNSGSLVDAPNNTYVNYYIIATNDMTFPIKAVVGTGNYATLLQAFNEQFDVANLLMEEVVAMYQITLHTNTAYTNKVVIASVRKLSSQANVLPDQILNGPSHAGLSKLSNDDHLQYVHISNARTITAAHTFNGVQTFVNGIKINSKPVVNLDGANKQYVDQQALLMSFLNA
jgi:hypothetical protein